jgi:hypothetical protein
VATEVKWALVATSVLSTLGGWAALAQPSPPAAGAAAGGAERTPVPSTGPASADAAAGAGTPEAVPASVTLREGIAQPTAAAPRVVTVPPPVPARGRVAAVSRSSR